MQAAPEGTQNVDALSRKGERYSIKTITFPSATTGVFYGFGEKEDKKILELSWEVFLKYKRWHKTMRAWNLSVTQNLLNDAKIIL